MKIKKVPLRSVLFVLAPIILFFSLGFYKFLYDFWGFSKPTNTYIEVFIPRSNKSIIPHETNFSRINTPIAAYKIKNSRYKIMVFRVELTSNNFNPSNFFINDKQILPLSGTFKGLNLENDTKSLYILDRRPTIHSIHVYINPNFPIQKLEKNNQFIYGKLKGDLIFSFNQENKRFISIETMIQDFDIEPSSLEFLCFTKNQKHYIAVGVGNPPEGAEENYLKSLILED